MCSFPQSPDGKTVGTSSCLTVRLLVLAQLVRCFTGYSLGIWTHGINGKNLSLGKSLKDRDIQRVDSWTISYRNMTQNFDICIGLTALGRNSIKTYNANTNLYHNWILLGDQAWLQSGWIWLDLKISCEVILKSFGKKTGITEWSNLMCSFALWVTSHFRTLFQFTDLVSMRNVSSSLCATQFSRKFHVRIFVFN